MPPRRNTLQFLAPQPGPERGLPTEAVAEATGGYPNATARRRLTAYANNLQVGDGIWEYSETNISLDESLEDA